MLKTITTGMPVALSQAAHAGIDVDAHERVVRLFIFIPRLGRSIGRCSRGVSRVGTQDVQANKYMECLNGGKCWEETERASVAEPGEEGPLPVSTQECPCERCSWRKV